MVEGQENKGNIRRAQVMIIVSERCSKNKGGVRRRDSVLVDAADGSQLTGMAQGVSDNHSSSDGVDLAW